MRIWTAAILIAGWAAAIAVSWPGHLSYDSIIQLHDGRTGFYHSWHPPVMAWLLGLADAMLPGAGLFVVFDATMFFGALLLLSRCKASGSWFAAIAAAGFALLPQCLLYQGIVWKDVLFADFPAWRWPMHVGTMCARGWLSSLSFCRCSSWRF